MKKTWIVTMRVVAPTTETAESIVTLVENALDEDRVLSDLLDVTNVRATEP